jgi:hypothetical protein
MATDEVVAKAESERTAYIIKKGVPPVVKEVIVEEFSYKPGWVWVHRRGWIPKAECWRSEPDALMKAEEVKQKYLTAVKSRVAALERQMLRMDKPVEVRRLCSNTPE